MILPYKEALEKWGEESQLFMLVEEMGELTQQVVKKYRGRKNRKALLEEAVDVQIMLNQLKITYSKQQWDKVFNIKLNRLRKRLKEK